jgi:hypothetical protein
MKLDLQNRIILRALPVFSCERSCSWRTRELFILGFILGFIDVVRFFHVAVV